MIDSPLLAQSQNEFRQTFDAFRQGARQEYEDFRQQANKEFVEFMRQAWIEFQKLPAIPIPEEEPPVPPTVMPEEDADVPIGVEFVPIEVVVSPTINQKNQPKPIAPVRDIPTPTDEPAFEFVFMGTKESVRIGKEHRIKINRCSERDIAEAWDAMCNERFNNVIRDCLLIRLEHELCDWAYLGMLQTLGDSFYGKGTDESILLSAFLYCQSGYSMRLCITDGHLEMLFASKHLIYELPYMDIEGELFYSRNLGEAHECRVFPYPFEGEHDMSLVVGKEQKLADEATPQRTLQSERYPEMKVSVSTNKNLLDFYSNYPTSQIGESVMTRWAMYAQTPICSTAQSKLYPALASMIRGRSQLDAVNRLLNWVQTAFVYEYDDKVWGRDRAFFADESLFYPYCDCEDRSILFSRLVRDLVGLDVALVFYPGHLATAVCFTEPVQGDYMMIRGHRFVIADPTYIGAPVGYTMPDLDLSAIRTVILAH